MEKVSRAAFDLLKQALALKGGQRLTVVSDSMSPLIGVGDLVDVAGRQSADWRRFDILVIYQSEKLICHYLHHINQSALSDKKYVTRPLKGRGEDLPISEGDVLGVVINFKLSPWQKLRRLFFS